MLHLMHVLHCSFVTRTFPYMKNLHFFNVGNKASEMHFSHNFYLFIYFSLSLSLSLKKTSEKQRFSSRARACRWKIDPISSKRKTEKKVSFSNFNIYPNE